MPSVNILQYDLKRHLVTLSEHAYSIPRQHRGEATMPYPFKVPTRMSIYRPAEPGILVFTKPVGYATAGTLIRAEYDLVEVRHFDLTKLAIAFGHHGTLHYLLAEEASAEAQRISTEWSVLTHQAQNQKVDGAHRATAGALRASKLAEMKTALRAGMRASLSVVS